MVNGKDSGTPDDRKAAPKGESGQPPEKKAQSTEAAASGAKAAPQKAEGEKKKGGIAGPVALGLIIAIAGNAALAIHPMFRGSQDHVITIRMIVLPVAIPILLLGIIAYIAGRTAKKGKIIAVGRIGLILGIVMLSLLISLPIGNYMVERDIARAKAFCMSLLDEGIIAPDARGNYPTSIADSLEDKELPRLLPDRFYMPTGNRFMFYISDPRDDTVQHTYSSERGTWTP